MAKNLQRTTHGVRGYYWAVVVPAIAMGMAEPRWREGHRVAVRALAGERVPDFKAPVHTWLKYEFLPAGDTPDRWEDEENYYNTKFAEMSDDRFRDYVDRVVIWARMNDIDVPPPTTEEEPWETPDD